MIVSKKNKVIVITPPKTGTHSITNYLTSSIEDQSEPVIKVNYPIYHLTLSEICYVFNIKIKELAEYNIVQCVRNPYTRMASAYFHQIELKDIGTNFESFLQRVEELKHLLPHNLDDFYISFYGDINYKYNSFRNNNWGGARFYYEQTWFNDLNVNNITYFKLEELSVDPSSLSTFLNVTSSEFPHINKNIKSTDYKQLYTESSISIIKELYQNDLNCFNYEF